MTLADSPHFLTITEGLLRNPPPSKLADLSQAAPRSTLYRVLAFYRHHRAAEYARGRLHVDQKKILQLATGLRLDVSVPDLIVNTAPGLSESVARLKGLGIPHRLGFATAANLMAYFEPHGIISLYAPPERKRDIAAALDGQGTHTVHVVFASMEDLGPPVQIDGFELTSPIRTLLDTLIDPAGGANAAFLEETLRARKLL